MGPPSVTSVLPPDSVRVTPGVSVSVMLVLAVAAVMPVVLYETLGRSLGEGREGAALIWGACQQLAASEADAIRRAGHEGE